MKKRQFLTLIFSLLVSIVAMGQQNPVHVSVQQKRVSPTEVDIIFAAVCIRYSGFRVGQRKEALEKITNLKE